MFNKIKKYFLKLFSSKHRNKNIHVASQKTTIIDEANQYAKIKHKIHSKYEIKKAFYKCKCLVANKQDESTSQPDTVKTKASNDPMYNFACALGGTFAREYDAMEESRQQVLATQAQDIELSEQKLDDISSQQESQLEIQKNTLDNNLLSVVNSTSQTQDDVILESAEQTSSSQDLSQQVQNNTESLESKYEIELAEFDVKIITDCDFDSNSVYIRKETKSFANRLVELVSPRNIYCDIEPTNSKEAMVEIVKRDFVGQDIQFINDVLRRLLNRDIAGSQFIGEGTLLFRCVIPDEESAFVTKASFSYLPKPIIYNRDKETQIKQILTLYVAQSDRDIVNQHLPIIINRLKNTKIDRNLNPEVELSPFAV